MNLVVETIVTVFKLVYYLFEALVITLTPTSLRRKDVTGKRVLITGAGSGLGRLMAQRFADLGCTMVLWDINKAMNEETAKLVKRSAVDVHAITCDLSKREDIYRAAKETKALVNDIDILINNAGIVTGNHLLDCSDEKIDRCIDVNTKALLWTTKCFLPGMLQRNIGHIVTIASGAGYFGTNRMVDYCTSKFGAVGFDDSLRQEILALEKDGIHVTCVCPFYINTGMFDGAKTRFPNLLPIMDQEYAVNRIMDAILTNQEVLLMPRLLFVLVALKNLFPTKVSTLACNFFGVTVSMDQFIGRGKNQ